MLDSAYNVLTQQWKDGIGFDRYANPFEQKWAWRDKFALPPPVERMIRLMEESLLDAARGLMPNDEIELCVDQSRHYAGAFIYEKGDHLSVHVDAGVHPITGWRKAVTALLYLGEGAPLEFWEGDSCMAEDPRLYEEMMVLQPHDGMVVLFANDDRAWHGVPAHQKSGPRVLLTVSFLARELPAEEGYRNQRERAYFIPRPEEEWTDEMFALRDQRAHPKYYAQAYRSVVPE